MPPGTRLSKFPDQPPDTAVREIQEEQTGDGQKQRFGEDVIESEEGDESSERRTVVLRIELRGFALNDERGGNTDQYEQDDEDDSEGHRAQESE